MRRISRDIRKCQYQWSGAYRSVETTNAIPLQPNEVEMEYEQTRIKHEGPNSKKWPGKNWVEEDEAHRTYGREHRPASTGGYNGGGFQCNKDPKRLYPQDPREQDEEGRS